MVKNMEEFINDAAEKALPKVVESLYEDLIQPGAKEFGKALATVLASTNTLLLPVSYLNETCLIRFKNRLKQLDAQLKLENESDICQVSNEIGVPALEKLFYISSDELSDLFIKLLKRASLEDEAHLAHPNFVNVLSSISPDEAKIINHTKGRPISFVSLAVEKSIMREEGYFMNTTERSNKVFTDIENSIEMLFPQNFHIYNTNMFSLGITGAMGYSTKPSNEHKIIIGTQKELIDKHMSQKFEIHPDGAKKNPIIEYGTVKFTDFGKMFVEACC